jgi:signal transduction histidine kinase/ActR/RegA family two-component response regulator
MLPFRRSAGRAYVIAVGGTALVAATWMVSEGSQRSLPTTFAFLLAVFAAGAMGGWKPGVLTTGLCLFATSFFLTHPLHRFGPPSVGDLFRLSPYALVGVAISFLCEGLHRAWTRLEERQRRLEAEIAERKRAEQAVQEQAEQLRDADRKKDEFLAVLAHELRNPIAPLSYALQLWPIVENDRPRMEELRTMMERQVEQMTRLIDDLLDVSRISRGKIQLRRERVDLATIISAAVEGLQPLIEASRQKVTVSLPSELVEVEGDIARLTQVFGNILNNAAKYTGREGVIWITAELSGSIAAVKIRDNGPGIPKHMLAQIFDLFQQVDQTITRSHGGLGIGLTLVKRLVELHGGTVEAHSEGPGKGSEFTVTLPVLPRLSVGRVGSASRHSLRQISGLPAHRILVVDDISDSATTLAMMLRTMGQDVTTANSGAAALDLIKSHRPNLVFLDIAMPGIDGYEVARRIRSDPATKNLYLVALTGYGQPEDRRRSIDAGFNHHLTKPANVDALQHVLLTAADSSASSPEAAVSAEQSS